MPCILVSPLAAVPDVIRSRRPSHLVTLLSPEHMIGTPDDFPAERHLRLGINDVVDVWAGESPPTSAHVEKLLTFARTWTARDPMLVHCWAGVSRSMAATYTILCDRLGRGNELYVAQAMRARAPHAYPNLLFVQYADDLLQRHGQMIEAIRSIGAGQIVSEGPVVEFPLRGL